MLSTAKTHLTFDEYLKYDDGTDNRYELVNGKLILINPPSIRHTLILKYLEKKFDAQIDRADLSVIGNLLGRQVALVLSVQGDWVTWCSG